MRQTSSSPRIPRPTRLLGWGFLASLIAWPTLTSLSSLPVTDPASPVLAKSLADVMQSNSYELQLGHFNMTSGEKSSSGYTVTDTVGQTAAGEFNSAGFTVLAGFQYLYSIPRFSFQITDLSIDLGELQAGVFSTGTNQVIISTPSSGYSLLTAAIHPLQLKSAPATTIPDTTCDTTCSITTAGAWTNTAQVGFGFNVAGTSADSDFINSTYFRPFADKSASESHQQIAAASSQVKNDTLSVTYQATIATTQSAGEYETAIEFQALPTY